MAIDDDKRSNVIYDLHCQARERYLCLSSGKFITASLVIMQWVRMHPSMVLSLLLILVWAFFLVRAIKAVRRSENTVDQLRRREDAGNPSW